MFKIGCRTFIERQRTSPVMFNVAHVLKPGMLEALAEGFKDLNPKPLGGEPKELIGAGKKIYEEGVPDAKIAPCATCHGPEAKGAGGFPRLAGQLHDYTSRKLTNWDKERGQDRAKPDASPIMEPIAHGLTGAADRRGLGLSRLAGIARPRFRSSILARATNPAFP